MENNFSDFVNGLTALNYSNQLDGPEHSWGSLCNLLSESCSDGSNSPLHKKRLARKGFADDSELCAYMSRAITTHIRSLLASAEMLTRSALLFSADEPQRAEEV